MKKNLNFNFLIRDECKSQKLDKLQKIIKNYNDNKKLMKKKH